MRIDPDLIDADAAKVVRRLQQSGYTAFLVGGCVRDLLLGRTPKDFDVATSAEPNEVKRAFRNCRIIGRRFRLAHVFFGPKIIETSTFRQNPRLEGAEGVEGENGGAEEEQELLIRRDNVFGTAEEDARRRDFTINGLFYNPATEEVIDYVGGAVDLSAGLIRTIGDPDIRLREDPIRILRAIKFAARLGFTIEPATYAAMLAARGEIPKCAAPRILEEIYRLLRGGAAAASMRLLLETGVLEVLVPELARLLDDAGVPAAPAPVPRPAAPPPPQLMLPHMLQGPEAALAAADLCGPGRGAFDETGEPAAPFVPALARPPVERCFATLELLDGLVREGPAPSNAVILGALLWPFLDDVLAEGGLRGHEVGVRLEDAIRPILIRLRASRRDSERVRQILLSQRRLAQPPRRKPRPSTLARREHFADALALFHITCQVRGLPQDEVDQWRHMLPAPGAPEEHLGGDAGQEPGRRRRRRGGRRRRRPERAGAPAEG
ncbi:MAG TPA: polynucleotide adenylyltransferase PcnB [Polyangia bacterium]